MFGYRLSVDVQLCYQLVFYGDIYVSQVLVILAYLCH